MSFQAMAWAVKQTVGDDQAKHLLLTLANFANDEAKAWPSITRLARDTEMARRTIFRKLDVLVEKGLISREQKVTPAGTYSVYTLTGWCHADTTSVTETPTSVTLTPGGGVTLTPKPISGEPIKEPTTLRTRKRVSIPEGFPFESDVRWTLKETPKLSPWDEAAKFRDYALKEAKTYADWPAAWRTWCRNAERWSAERKRA